MAKPARTKPSAVAMRGGGIPGFRILAQDARATLVMPDFQKHAIPLIFHLVPPIFDTDENGNPCKPYFGPYRDGMGEIGLSSFFFRGALARGVGIKEDAQTFLLCDVGGGEEVNDTLYAKFYTQINKAVKSAMKRELDYVSSSRMGKRKINPLKWAGLVPNDKTSIQDQAFPNPKRAMTSFFQAIPLWDNNKHCFSDDGLLYGSNEGDLARLVMASNTANGAIIEAVNHELPNANPMSEDYAAQYEHGDLTQLDGSGKWLILYNPEKHDISRLLSAEVSQDSDDGEEEEELDLSGGVKKSGMQNSTYAVAVTDKVRLPLGKGDKYVPVSVKKAIGARAEEIQANVLKNYQPIWEYFDIPSQEQQALYIAMGFQSMPEILYYGFEDIPEFWTSDVEALLAKRVQVATPGNSQDEEFDDDDESGSSKGKDKPGPKPKTGVAFDYADDDDDEESGADASDGEDVKSNIDTLLKKAAAAKKKTTKKVGSKTTTDDAAPRKKKKKKASGAATTTTKRKKKKGPGKGRDGMPTT